MKQEREGKAVFLHLLPMGCGVVHGHDVGGRDVREDVVDLLEDKAATRLPDIDQAADVFLDLRG